MTENVENITGRGIHRAIEVQDTTAPQLRQSPLVSSPSQQIISNCISDISFSDNSNLSQLASLTNPSVTTIKTEPSTSILLEHTTQGNQQGNQHAWTKL